MLPVNRMLLFSGRRRIAFPALDNGPVLLAITECSSEWALMNGGPPIAIPVAYPVIVFALTVTSRFGPVGVVLKPIAVDVAPTCRNWFPLIRRSSFGEPEPIVMASPTR